MSDLFSSLLIFTIFKTILSTFFYSSKFYKNMVKGALTEMECSVAGTTTLDRECINPCPMGTLMESVSEIYYE
jgi:hypothetical protein